MRTTLRNRAAALLAATTLLSGGALTVGAEVASADPSVSFRYIWDGKDNENLEIDVYNGSSLAGWSQWQSDPVDTFPGDAMFVYDYLADGYGIETHLSNGRIATTRGHNSPYMSPWATGNLPEGTKLQMWTCLVKGSYEKCSAKKTVTA
ncbi:hypothetical protein ACIQGZ_14435 [Streptomyces sp. NPDC092296]|uniref:hypothetical protein n=1 Tax=Streptomyces sp. NPDC092296 TaxID=3366012 RepID=UPI00381F4D80